MMAIIAFAAIGLGTAFELVNRVQRDRLLRLQARRYTEAAIHHRRALECRDAEDRQLPYRPADRAKVLAGDQVRSMIPFGGYRSWQAEYGDHQ